MINIAINEYAWQLNVSNLIVFAGLMSNNKGKLLEIYTPFDTSTSSAAESLDA